MGVEVALQGMGRTAVLERHRPRLARRRRLQAWLHLLCRLRMSQWGSVG